jgi:uncharacterized protein involved in exopolysaccharide biosynthesis
MTDTTTRPPTDAALEPWTFRDLWRQYWRIPVVALLAALIAFTGSFIVPPTYAAGTRVVIRAKDSTVLNSTGTPLGSQPGVVDSQLSAVLADTQAALLSNRAVAERVVDELALDQIVDDDASIIGKARRVFAAVYKRSRAIITHGFYKETDRRTARIDMVQSGLAAKQIDDGYAMDIVATWDDPDIAADIANTAADVLVEMSNERFQEEAQAYRDFLQAQTDAALVAEQDARDAVAAYKAEHGITTTPEQDAQLILASEDDINAQIRATQAELEAVRAEADSLRSDLAGTSPFATTNQEIVTGRSQTDINTTASNPAYVQLLASTQAAEAEVRALTARLGALEGALETATGASAAGISEEEAELAGLQVDVEIASATRRQLTAELEAADLNAQRTAVEITRLDVASSPTYPVGPKRYLFLAVGVLVGALVGFVWSFLRAQRQLRLAAGDPAVRATAADTDDVVDLTADTTLTSVTVGSSEHGAVPEVAGSASAPE